MKTEAQSFDVTERDVIYRAIAERRDVRQGYLEQPLPDAMLKRLLTAAHNAPSVGLMQPSRFIVIRDRAIRQRIHESFQQANTAAAEVYEGEKKDLYKSLKLEGILEAPQNLCIACDQHSLRGHGLGRQTMQEAAVYSTVCAIQNIWLAARAEDIGVGWISILDPASLRAILRIPSHILPVAYLCIGYVDQFASIPDLERRGWEARMALDQVTSYDTYSEPALP